MVKMELTVKRRVIAVQCGRELRGRETMKNKFGKITSTILVLVMCLQMLPLNVFAAQVRHTTESGQEPEAYASAPASGPGSGDAPIPF